MQYLLFIIYTLLLIYSVVKSRFYQSSGFPVWVPVLVFLSKFLMGSVLVWIYTYYYDTQESADIFKYFADGNILYMAWADHPLDYLRMLTGIGGNAEHLMKYYDTCAFWFKGFNYGLLNDNRIIIRFNALVRLISMGNIYTHTLFMSFLSFSGLWGIYRVLLAALKRQKWLLLGVVFFLPSLWFWSSGLLKEGFMMGVFGGLLYTFHLILQGRRTPRLFVQLFLFLILCSISKFYVLLSAMPGLLVWLLLKKYPGKPFFLFLGVHLGLLLLVVLLGLLSPLDFIQIIERKQHDFVTFAQSLQHVGSLVAIPDLEPGLWSLLKTAPQGFWHTLLRPHLGEASNAMMLLAAVENTLLLLGILLTLIFLKRPIKWNPLLLFSISFVFILFTLSGLTTPVLGALVRYKAPALPFLGALYLFLMDDSKIIQLFKRFKKHA